MNNKYFWIEVINGLDEKLTDSVACSLFAYQKRNDVEVSDYAVEGDKTAKKDRKHSGILTLVACIAVMACLAVLTVVIVKNNIAVQPLDSNSEYSHLTEETQYTHSVKVYFLEKELGKEFISDPEIIKNKTIANSIKTYLFAGNFDEEYYVFGDIENADNLRKIGFNDPIGGQSGISKDGWNLSYNPTFLNFVCKEESIREFCDTKYEYGTMKEKVEEITDVYVVCIPEYAPLIHFKDGDKVYFIHLDQDVVYGDTTSYGIFTHEELIDHYEIKERPITINQKEVVNGCFVGNLARVCEVNITKLLEHIVDDEFIVCEGSKTSYYRWNKSTGEKDLAAVVDSEAQTIEAYPSYNTDQIMSSTQVWNENGCVSTFRDGELFMNYKATDMFLSIYFIMLSSNGGTYRCIDVSYDETYNIFTSDTDFLQRNSFYFKDMIGPLYEEDGKAKLHLSAGFPYADIYHGLPIEFEFSLKSNGVPVLIDGKESCLFTSTLNSKEDRVFESDVWIDTKALTFNEYGYSTGLTAYLTYTVDASEIIDGKIETHTISYGVVVRNNPDNLTEEELVTTNPVISGCKKISDNEWAFAIDVGVFADVSEKINFYMEFSDEDATPVEMTLPDIIDDGKYLCSVGHTLKKEDKGIINVVIRDVEENSTLTLDINVRRDGYVQTHYKEKFLLTD